MNTFISKSSLAMLACAAALTLGASSAAQAQANVAWSVGVSSPGVQIGVSNAPVYGVQQPVYAQGYGQPAPVYVQSAPVYVPARPVYYVPRPVVFAPPFPVFYGRPGYGYGRGFGHQVEFRGGGRFEHERFGHFEGRNVGHVSSEIARRH